MNRANVLRQTHARYRRRWQQPRQNTQLLVVTATSSGSSELLQGLLQTTGFLNDKIHDLDVEIVGIQRCIEVLSLWATHSSILWTRMTSQEAGATLEKPRLASHQTQSQT
eukprot:1291985-Amphidinium_carterae.1